MVGRASRAAELVLRKDLGCARPGEPRERQGQLPCPSPHAHGPGWTQPPSPPSLALVPLGWALLTFGGNMVATQWGWVTLGSIKPSRHQDQVRRELPGDGHHDYPVRVPEGGLTTLDWQAEARGPHLGSSPANLAVGHSALRTPRHSASQKD